MKPFLVLTLMAFSVFGIGARIDWTPSTSTGLTATKVYRGTTCAGPFTLITLTPLAADATTYYDANLAPGSYGWVVTAIAGTNESAYSSCVPGTIPNPPAAPTNVTSTRSGAGANIGWTASTGADGYRILRASGACTTGQTFTLRSGTNLVTGLTFFDPDVPVGSWCFIVRAVGPFDNPSANSAGSTLVILPLPLAPGGVTATIVP